MLGCYDFCGHYDWTFAWLHEQGGDALLRDYWREAIAGDSQRHASQLIEELGFEGMKKYWAHTLEEEAAGYTMTEGDAVIRIDMHECPSKGFLLRNNLSHSTDYCDHCIGWIGPVMEKAGFTIDHEHNHCGKCWWEMRRTGDERPPSTPGELADKADVRSASDWINPEASFDLFQKTTSVENKEPANPDQSASSI